MLCRSARCSSPASSASPTYIAPALLVLLALPLVPALVRRLRLPLGWRSVVQLLALLFGIAVVVGVVVLTLRPDRTLATMERKDVMIYIVGALVWYLPSFGIAAGVWRRDRPGLATPELALAHWYESYYYACSTNRTTT